MMQTFFLLLFLQAQAFQLSPGYEQAVGGTILKTIQVTCQDSDLNLCHELCGQSKCKKIEPTCVNCAGASSEFLNILFSRASHFFQSTQKPISKDLILSLISSDKLVLLDSQSLFNFYTNIRSDESAAEFNLFCPQGTVRSIIALRLDESGFPIQPVASVCESKDKTQLMLGITHRRMLPLPEAKLN